MPHRDLIIYQHNVGSWPMRHQYIFPLKSDILPAAFNAVFLARRQNNCGCFKNHLWFKSGCGGVADILWLVHLTDSELFSYRRCVPWGGACLWASDSHWSLLWDQSSHTASWERVEQILGSVARNREVKQDHSTFSWCLRLSFASSCLKGPKDYDTENRLRSSLSSQSQDPFSSVAQSYPTLCDPMDWSMPGFPVHHQLPELTQTHVYQVMMPSNHLIPVSSCFQSFPALGSFQMSQFFTSGGQSIGASASASVLPMNIQDWFPLGLISWISLLFKGLKSLLQHHSSKVSLLELSFLYSPTLTFTHDYWKRHSFD